jgi:hypothetical protein
VGGGQGGQGSQGVVLKGWKAWKAWKVVRELECGVFGRRSWKLENGIGE